MRRGLVMITSTSPPEAWENVVQGIRQSNVFRAVHTRYADMCGVVLVQPRAETQPAQWSMTNDTRNRLFSLFSLRASRLVWIHLSPETNDAEVDVDTERINKPPGVTAVRVNDVVEVMGKNRRLMTAKIENARTSVRKTFYDVRYISNGPFSRDDRGYHLIQLGTFRLVVGRPPVLQTRTYRQREIETIETEVTVRNTAGWRVATVIVEYTGGQGQPSRAETDMKGYFFPVDLFEVSRSPQDDGWHAKHTQYASPTGLSTLMTTGFGEHDGITLSDMIVSSGGCDCDVLLTADETGETFILPFLNQMIAPLQGSLLSFIKERLTVGSVFLTPSRVSLALRRLVGRSLPSLFVSKGATPNQEVNRLVSDPARHITLTPGSWSRAPSDDAYRVGTSPSSWAMRLTIAIIKVVMALILGLGLIVAAIVLSIHFIRRHHRRAHSHIKR